MPKASIVGKCPIDRAANEGCASVDTGIWPGRAAVGRLTGMRGSMRTSPGRSPREVRAVRQARRLVGLERNYHCSSCGFEQRSYTRLSSCQGCGEQLAVAIIRRAAVAAA